MLFSPIASLRDHERATLKYSYAGEFGRGIFASLCTEFALVVAISYFGIKDTTLIWLIASAPYFGMLAAVLGVTQLGRHRKKSLVLGIEVASRLCAILAAFCMTGLTFTLAMGLAIALSSVSVPLVSGIYGENFDKLVRGRAVSRLQAVHVATIASFAALAGAILGQDSAAFRQILVAVSLASIGCSLIAYRLPERRRRNNGARPHLRALVKVLWHDRAFAYVELIWFIIGFCNLWLVPMRVLHLVEIGMDDFRIMIATTAILNATQVLTLRFWGSFLYRMNFAVYRIIVGTIFVIALPVFFYGESFPVVCFGAFLWGTGLAGGALSWGLVGTFFTTSDRLPEYMGIHSFFCGVRGLFGPYLALQLYAVYGAQALANISVAGNVLTLLMFVPLFYVMRRRSAHLDRLEAALCEDA